MGVFSKKGALNAKPEARVPAGGPLRQAVNPMPQPETPKLQAMRNAGNVPRAGFAEASDAFGE